MKLKLKLAKTLLSSSIVFVSLLITTNVVAQTKTLEQ